MIDGLGYWVIGLFGYLVIWLFGYWEPERFAAVRLEAPKILLSWFAS